MTDVLAQDALAALDSVIADFLPPAPSADMTRTLRIEPTRVRPVGLGGYVGNHLDPNAGQYGRRVLARISIDINGGDDTAARNHITDIGTDLLTRSRSELRAAGLQRLDRIPVEDGRSLALDVDFEYIDTPTTAEGVISALALDIKPDD